MTDLVDLNAPAAVPAAPERLMKWFIIHTYSGYEAKVMEQLRQRIKMEEREAFFGDIQVPEETYEEMKVDAKSGRKERVLKKRKSFPGYLLVQIAVTQKGGTFEMEDADWHLVRNTPKVTSFVGANKKRPTPLTDDEVRRMMAACDPTTVPGLRDMALLALLFGGGLRRREASKLRVADFDRVRGEVRVLGKGSKKRPVPLSTDATAIVAAWLTKAPTSGAQPLLIAFEMNGDVRRKGGVPTGLTSPGVYSVIEAIAKRAGVTDITPHDARRTRITRMLLAGEPLVLVQRIAGHESVETTGRYVRTSQDQAQQAAARVPMVGVEAGRSGE